LTYEAVIRDIKNENDLNILSTKLPSKELRHPVVESIGRAYAELNDEIANYLIVKLGLSSEAAEDAVQAAFERALRLGNDKLAEIKNARAFLYRASYNAAVDYCRHANVGKRHLDDTCIDTQKHIESIDPFRNVSVNQELDILVSALKKMPKKRQKLIIMNRVLGLSYAEISRQVSLSETVVRKHVNRALSDLLNILRVRTGESRK